MPIFVILGWGGSRIPTATSEVPYAHDWEVDFTGCGTTRMSADPSDGVVDENLAVHKMSNVYVASSSTFVTSGQANSTFMIVAFALRLADHLHKVVR